MLCSREYANHSKWLWFFKYPKYYYHVYFAATFSNLVKHYTDFKYPLASCHCIYIYMCVNVFDCQKLVFCDVSFHIIAFGFTSHLIARRDRMKKKRIKVTSQFFSRNFHYENFQPPYHNFHSINLLSESLKQGRYFEYHYYLDICIKWLAILLGIRFAYCYNHNNCYLLWLLFHLLLLDVILCFYSCFCNKWSNIQKLNPYWQLYALANKTRWNEQRKTENEISTMFQQN